MVQILPLLKHACGESDQLLCWLYTPPEVNLREHISCTPPQSSNKAELTLALKPRGDITSPKQGYEWPQKNLRKKILKKDAVKRFSHSISFSVKDLLGSIHTVRN